MATSTISSMSHASSPVGPSLPPPSSTDDPSCCMIISYAHALNSNNHASNIAAPSTFRKISVATQSLHTRFPPSRHSLRCRLQRGDRPSRAAGVQLCPQWRGLLELVGQREFGAGGAIHRDGWYLPVRLNLTPVRKR